LRIFRTDSNKFILNYLGGEIGKEMLKFIISAKMNLEFDIIRNNHTNIYPPANPMKNHNPTATTFACNSTANPHTVKIHDSAPRSTRGRRNAGFSLVEIMITVLIIAVLGGVALTSFGTTRESTSQIAMQGDASMMNKAIQAYTAGGGSLDGVTNPNDVLAKLKTKPLATQAATIAGARGPFVDLRLELRPATSANAFSLVYLPERTSFVMVNGSSGLVTGVNEELAKQPVATEERHVSLALATEDKWVWDYADAATLDRPAADRPLDKRSLRLQHRAARSSPVQLARQPARPAGFPQDPHHHPQ